MAKDSEGRPIDLQRGELLDVAGVKLTVESCGQRGVRLRALPPLGYSITGLEELQAGQYCLTFARTSSQNYGQ